MTKMLAWFTLPGFSFSAMLATVSAAALCLMALTITGCVTTTESSFANKANPEEALNQYVDLALEYVKRGEYVRARKHLDRAMEIDNDFAPAHGVLGLLYQRDGEAGLAEKSYLEALSQDAGYTRGRTYYGSLLFAQGRYAEAKTQFERASEDTAFSSRAQVFTNIALCEIKLGDIPAAVSAYERSLRLDRVSGRALSGITELLIQQNKWNEANKYYTRLISLVAQQGLQHTPQTLWQGIRIASSFGNQAQAQVFASMLKELYPSSAEYAAYLSAYSS